MEVILVPLRLLHAAPWNPRSIKDERFQNLCKSIQADPDFLWRRPILAQMDGTIYAGNMRYRAAQHLNIDPVPALIEDVSDQLAKERALRDNAQWGEWEPDELAAMIDQLRLDGSQVELLGFDERELQQLLDRLNAPNAGDPEAVPDLPDEPVTQPGDIWVLGDHRVMCGDATKIDDMAQLMVSKESARCIWTDPPYGVDYTGKTKDKLKIQNDEAIDLHGLLSRAFTVMDTVLRPGGAIYVAHPSQGKVAVVFMETFMAQGWRLHQELVWVKNRIIVGHSDYHFQHEPIMFGYKPAPSGRYGRGGAGWYGENNASSVFQIDSPAASPDHPTAKPVALIGPMLRNSSRTGEIVLDPFLGSGSTLIAAETIQRRCFGMEIDPRYVDVCVKRWVDYTGGDPVRI